MFRPVFTHPSLLLPAKLLRVNQEGTRVAVVREDLVQLVDVRRQSLSAARLSSAVVDAAWCSAVTLVVCCEDGSISLLNALDRSHQSIQPCLQRPIALSVIGNSTLFALYQSSTVFEFSLADFTRPLRQFKLALAQDPVNFTALTIASQLFLMTFGSGEEYHVQFEVPSLKAESSVKTSIVSRLFRSGKAVELAEPVQLTPVRTLSDAGRVAQAVVVAGQRAFVSDSLGRVAELDLVLCVMSRLWKGYRGAEVAVILPNILLILQPRRRDVCEVFNLLDGSRSSVLALPQSGRLLSNGWLVLGSSLVSIDVQNPLSRRPSGLSCNVPETPPDHSGASSPRTAEPLDEASMRSLPDATLLSYHLRRNRLLVSQDERRVLAASVADVLETRQTDERLGREKKLLRTYVELLTPRPVERDIKRKSWGETTFGVSLKDYSNMFSRPGGSGSSIALYLSWMHEKLGQQDSFGTLGAAVDQGLFDEASASSSASYEAFCKGQASELMFSPLLGAGVVYGEVRDAVSLVFEAKEKAARSLVSYLLSVPIAKLLEEQAPTSGVANPAVVQGVSEFDVAEIVQGHYRYCPAHLLPQMALICAFRGLKEEVDALMEAMKKGENMHMFSDSLQWDMSTLKYAHEVSQDPVINPTIHLFLASQTLSQDLQIYRIQQSINSLNSVEFATNPHIGAVAFFLYQVYFKDKLFELKNSGRNSQALKELAGTAIGLVRLALKLEADSGGFQRSLLSRTETDSVRQLLGEWFLVLARQGEVKIGYLTAFVLSVEPETEAISREIDRKDVPKIVRSIATRHPLIALELAELFDLRGQLEGDLLYALVSAFEDWRLDEGGWARKVVQRVAVRSLEERLAFVVQTLGDDLGASGGVVFSVMTPEEVERLVCMDLGDEFVRRCEKLTVVGVLRSIILAGSAPHVAAVTEVREIVNKARRMLDSLPDAA